jgi:putative transposase
VFYLRSLGKIKIPSNNKKVRTILDKYNGQKGDDVPSTGLCDCRISLDSIGDYWLQIPYKRFPKIQRNIRRKKFVALDPGVRTFQTFYSQDGACGEIGKNDIQRIYRLCGHMDKLQSKLSNSNGKERRSQKKAWLRMIQRIKNLVNEVHKKTSLYLTQNFQTIILPKFETNKMVNTTLAQSRNIGSKTARGLMVWSHYRFRMYLQSVCDRTYTNLKIVTEEYTSKTCGSCGNIKYDLGSNKTYCCNLCNYQMDRDINAARNILIKFLRQMEEEKNLDPGLQGLP